MGDAFGLKRVLPIWVSAVGPASAWRAGMIFDRPRSVRLWTRFGRRRRWREGAESRMRAVTHDGPFHADDVFADAVLRAARDDVRLTRSRDPAVIADADLVFDVGGSYDPSC
jgi:hypothetical protein